MDKQICLETQHNVPRRRNESANRRADGPLREAINTVESHLYDPYDTSCLYQKTLIKVLDLTKSQNGAVLTFEKSLTLTDDAKSRDYNVVSCLRRNMNGDLVESDIKSYLHSVNLKHHLQRNLVSHLPVYFNAPIPREHHRLLAMPNQVSALMIVPIVNQNRICGILVANKQQGSYNANDVTRLLPLMGAVSCALRTSESVRGHFPELERSLNNNHYLSSFIAASPLAVLVINSEAEIIAFNQMAERVFRHDHYHLDGENILTLMPGYEEMFCWSRQESEQEFIAHSASTRVWEDQICMRQNGDEFIANITVFRYKEGHAHFTTLQIQDISQLRASADEYRRTSQHFSVLKHLVPVGILHIDTDWNCVYANDMWYELSGLLSEESDEARWVNAVHENDVRSFLEDIHYAMENGNDHHCEIRLISPLGKIRWIDFRAKILFDQQGYTQGFLATFADITDRLEAQEHLKHLAEYDPLTGLANKNLLHDRLRQAFYQSERDNTEITILFIDLDGFKDVNDTLGHDAGDSLLVRVGERLQNTLRKNDTVARFGGDEFVVLLGQSDATRNKVEAVAEKIVETIAHPYYLTEREVYVTVSVGVAKGTFQTSSPQQIMKEADTALYRAKRDGKNTYQYFTHSLDEESKSRLEMINHLRGALERGEYELYYQAQAQVFDSKPLGVEALLRFNHPEFGIIQPDQFIHLLEESRQIIDVGEWVIRSVCEQLQLWIQDGVFPEDGFVSINVSPQQLTDNRIVKIIESACQDFNVKPANLVIEITESVLINKEDEVKSILMALKTLGVRLALDDFGTGYSSLSYLQTFPIDHIKIDKSFVLNLVKESNEEKIVKAIIALAKSLGLRVTAEGVETELALVILESVGCDFYQGYRLAVPVCANDVHFRHPDEQLVRV